AGYETSRMKFKADASHANIDAFNLGIYASYLSGPIFADLIVLDDLANVNFTAPSVVVRGTRTGKSVGGSLDAGYHYSDADSGIFIEPSATFTVADSMLDTISPPGTSF